MIDAKLIKELRERTSLSITDCKKALEEANSDVDAAIGLLKNCGELKGQAKAARIATEGRICTAANNSASVVSIAEVNCQTDFVARSAEFQELLQVLCNKMSHDCVADFDVLRKELVAKTGENIVLRRRVEWNDPPTYSYRTWYNHPGDKLAVIVEFVMPDAATYAKAYHVLAGGNGSFADNVAMQIAAMAPLAISKDSLTQEQLYAQWQVFSAQLFEEGKPVSSWPKIIEGKFAKWYKEVCLLEQESVIEPKRSVGEQLSNINKQIGGTVSISRFVRYELGEGLDKKVEDLREEVGKLLD